MTYTWFFNLHWAFPFNQLSLIISWLFYNSKNFTLNLLASLFERTIQATFLKLHFTNAMARSCAFRSLFWNLLSVDKEKLAGPVSKAVFNNNNSTPYSSIFMLNVLTFIPLLVFVSAKLVSKYANANLQKTTKTTFLDLVFRRLL